MKQDRVIFLDYLRGIACFLVMMVHASEAFYGVGDVPILSDAHKFWIAIWDGMSRISVPLFVITSAYLLVPMKEKQSWGDKIFMMSYDIHSGGIGGIFGKVIAFLVSLTAASLPFTGLAIWLHRHRKKE